MKNRLAKVIESFDREKRAGAVEFCGSPLLRPPKSGAADEARNHLLRRFGRDPGVFLAGTSGDEPCYLGMPEGEDGNILVVGGNGSGKTSSIAIPTLATWNGAIFALDIKGELGAAYTSLYQRGLKSRPALIFNLSDPACLGFDPFGWLIEDGADNVISNVWDLVCCLLPNSSNDSQPFWVEAERGVLAAALLYFFKRGLGFTEAICLTLEKSCSQLCAEIMENGDMEEKLFLGEVEEGRSEMFAGIDRGLRNRLILFAADPVISHTLRGTREGAACFSWDDLDHYNFFLQIPAEQIEEWSGVISLMCTQLIRHLERRADRFSPGGSKSPQLLLLLDEFPRFGKMERLTAAMTTLRSKGVNFCLIIQSLAQLEKNYGKEGAEIIMDNVQDTIFGGFAPNSRTAEVLSKALGSRTVLSGSVSQGKDNASKSLQMMERALLTPDELKSLPKGTFIVMKTGTHPMRTRLRLFLEWGITFGEAYETPDCGRRPVYYADCRELERAIEARYGLRPAGQVRTGV